MCNEKRQIVESAGELAETLLDMAYEFEEEANATPSIISFAGSRDPVSSTTTSIDSTVSSPFTNKGMHTREHLSYTCRPVDCRTGVKRPLQARCIWCSCIEGKERKIQLCCL